ncbi:MAG: hypothetical protein JSR59_11700 [Proteobacteria bacterium]|nr:hypothetical protein [Pseudomonadota bacterium]
MRKTTRPMSAAGTSGSPTRRGGSLGATVAASIAMIRSGSSAIDRSLSRDDAEGHRPRSDVGHLAAGDRAGHAELLADRQKIGVADRDARAYRCTVSSLI